MRTLVVTHYFPPEIGAPQARLSELARAWADTGDTVTVLTGLPNHPTGVIPPEYRGVRRRLEHHDGYRVYRTWLYATPNEGIAKKTLGHLSFMASSALLGRRRTGPADVVVVSSPTFFAIFSGWYLARRKRARLVVEIRDLWPAIFVELGVLTNPVIIRVLEAIELAAYRAADAVVVVSEGFRDNLVARGVDPAKVFTIRNGVDLERFTPAPGDPEAVLAARTRLGAAPGETLVLYIGAHGISHGLTAIADAAATFADAPIHVAFVGEGAAKADLEARVRELRLGNVTLLPGVPRDDVPALLDAADVCLVPLRDVPLFSTFIPSKIFEYFGAGKAVIGAVRGEPAEILRAGGAVVVEPEDVDAIAAAVRALAADPGRRASMGQAGHAYVREHFDRRVLAARYREILASVVDRRTAAPARAGDRSPNRPPVTTVVRGIVAHPANRGTVAGLRAVGRFAAWQVWQRSTGRPWTTRRLLGGHRLRCYPHSTAAAAVLYEGVPEFEHGHLVHDVLAPGDVFVDVGANVGVYSLIAAAVPSVEVHAFEPSSDSFDRLRENIDLNGLGGRVLAHRAAVGANEGEATITVGHDTTNAVVDPPSTTDRRPADGPTERVRQTTLDAALDDDQAARVAVVKIDVEGAEPAVLAGARSLLQHVKPVLVIEANDVPAVQAILAPLGYEPCAYDPATGALTTIEWSRTRHPNVLAVADLELVRKRLAERRPA